MCIVQFPKHLDQSQPMFSSHLFSLFMIILLYANSCTALIETKYFKLSPKEYLPTLWEFKFAKDGTVKIDFHKENAQISSVNSSIQFLLCVADQISEEHSNLLLSRAICQGKVRPCTKQQVLKPGSSWPLRFTIPSTDWYKITMANCPGKEFSGSLNIVAQNPGGEYLSLSEVPYPMVYTVFTLIWVVLLFFWTFHLYQYRIWNIKLQKAIVIIPLFQVVICLFKMLLWREKSSSGLTNTTINAFVFQIDIFNTTYRFGMFILMAKGWMITRGDLT